MSNEVRYIPLGDIRKELTEAEMTSKMNFKTNGLLTGLTEGVTKDGKPFVVGKIQSKGTILSFRMFDINIEHFEKKYEVSAKVSIPASVLGYYCEHGLTIKKMCILSVEEGLNFVNTSIFPVEDSLRVVTEAVDMIFTEELKALAERVLSFNEETIKYFPYSQEVHTEVGGYLQCLANLLQNFSVKGWYNVYGDDFISCVDMEVIKTAIICHNIGWLAFASADQYGVISDAGEFAFSVYGSPAGVSLLMVYNLIREIMVGKPTSAKAMNVVHCLAVLAGSATPSTLEAEMFKNIIEAEKSEYLAFNLVKNLSQGEMVKSVGNNFLKL